MTSKVVPPDKYELRGIFTIERDALLELDAILTEIEKDFKRYATNALNQAVVKYMHDSNLNPDAHRDRVKRDLKARYPFSGNGRTTELLCATNRKFSGPDFASILDNNELATERPISAEVNMKYGTVSLKIKLLGQFVVNCIDLSVSSDAGFAQKAIARIRQWADDRRRFDYLRPFAFPLGLAGFSLLLFGFMVSPGGLFTTISDKSEAIAQSRRLLEDGVKENELAQAVEFILRFYVNDFTTTTHFDVKPWFATLLIIGAGLLLFGVLCPKSIIAVGQNVRRLRFAEFFFGKFWILVSAWLTAIITSALGSNLYEYVRDTHMISR